MSFYIKYRPQVFEELIGQNHIRITLQNALIEQKTVHAYLFCGSRGTGKTSTARILAKSINCTDPLATGGPCNKCQSCTAANNSNLVDLIEIDAASNRGIDEMRDLREKIQFAPTQSKCKIYIIDEVHMLTKEAFNAILKTLEEPPDHSYFILATTESHKIPDTIISRCQRFNFRRLEDQDIIKQLEIIAQTEKINIDKESLLLIAKHANGGMRDAISTFEQVCTEKDITYDKIRQKLGIVGHQFHEDFFNLLKKQDIKGAFDGLNEMNSEGYDLAQFNREFLLFLREQMYKNLTENESLNFIIFLTQIFSIAQNEIKSAVIPQLPLEIAIIKSCQSQQLNQPEKSEKKSFFNTLGFTNHNKKNESKDKNQSIKKEEIGTAEKTEHFPLVKEKEILDKVITPSITNDTPLNLDLILEQWPRVIEKITTPFVKLSFKDAKPVNFTKNILTVNFKSKFHKEKIDTSKNRNEIHNALEQTFQTNIQLNIQLTSINNTIKDQPKSENQKTEDHKQEDLKDMIKEVFG